MTGVTFGWVLYVTRWKPLEFREERGRGRVNCLTCRLAVIVDPMDASSSLVNKILAVVVVLGDNGG